MAEISRNNPSDVTAFVAPKGYTATDICSLDDGEPTFRDAVHTVNETAKKADIKKRPRTDSQNMRKPKTAESGKPQCKSQAAPAIRSARADKKESTIAEDVTISQEAAASRDRLQAEVVDLPGIETDIAPQETQNLVFIPIEQSVDLIDEGELKDVLSDLELIENEECGDYTADDYTATHDIKDSPEVEESSTQNKPEVVIFANELQIATPKPTIEMLKINESVPSDEFQNQATSPDVQSVQPGLSRQNMHEGTERHVDAEHPDSGQPEIKLSAEEQKAVDAFIRLKETPDRAESNSVMNIITANREVPQAEMKRSLVVPMQLVTTPQNETVAQENPDHDIHQVDLLASSSATKADKGNQESMNFSQFSGSSSDMKNMAESSKVATYNLVSTNPAAEFIETLKQNFKQFGKVQATKLTVQMRHSGKNLTVHFNTDADQVMNVTFRTTDKDWTEMLQEHENQISDVFEDSNHTVNIKYLGE